jgi:putative transposase
VSGDYGAFFYSHSNLDKVISYIPNKRRLIKLSFKEEYMDFLKEFEVGFKNEYLFEWIGS